MVSLYVYRYLFTKVLCDDLGKLFHVVTILSESLVIYKAKIKPFFIPITVNNQGIGITLKIETVGKICQFGVKKEFY